MELSIQNDTSVRDVQSQFTSCFPYLQIQFYRTADSGKKIPNKPGELHADERFKQILNNNTPLQVEINQETTVSDLQNVFRNFGLNVQVFRKFGTFWIATTLTDDWTLQRQNKEALLLSMPGEKLKL